MRIPVVGAGAVGGYFGGRLIQAGRDIAFLVRPKKAAQIQSDGLRILSPMHGDFTVRPRAITSGQIVSPYDVIFLSVKGYDLAAAMDDFAPAVGPQTVIIPVLNGMHHMDVLTERLGKHAVLGGVCFVATEVDLLERGRKHGISAPIVQAAFVSLSIYQRERARVTVADRALNENIEAAA